MSERDEIPSADSWSEGSESVQDSNDLKYFVDQTVQTFITSGVHRSLSVGLIQELFSLCFQRGISLQNQGLAASYFQVFRITSETSKESTMTQYKITMEQEQPDYESKHMKEITFGKSFNGSIWVIENWNGVPKDKATVDDHYITMLLPEEY